MGNRREDSLITSLQELHRMEEARMEDEARRRAEAERVRAAEVEAARAEALAAAERREREAREAREADARARADAQRREEEAQLAREMAVRAQAEAALETARLERIEEHERALAEIRARSRRGLSAGSAVLIAVGALAVTAVGGFLGVYQPMVREHDARMVSLEQRARAERDALRALPPPPVVAPVVIPAAPPPATVAAASSTAPTRRARHTDERIRQRPIVRPAPAETLGSDLDRSLDPFAVDDGARGVRRR